MILWRRDNVCREEIYAPLAQLVAALSSLLGGVRTQHRHGTAGRDRRNGGSHARARISCVSDQPRQVALRAIGDLGKRARVTSVIIKAASDLTSS